MATATRASWKALADLFKGGVSKRFALFAVALGLVLLVAIWWVFDVLPDLAVNDGQLTDNERLQRENDVRTTGLQALAGVVLALGAAFTAYSVLSTREGQLDERFARALELMANENSHVVSGAIFSLDRIAAQSRFDRPAAVDVLSGFVRAGAPLDDNRDELRPEVMDALRVISRINELWRSPEPSLEGTCWKGASLLSLDLSGSQLSESVFENAALFETKFRKAKLFRANLSGAILVRADLSRAYLKSADLSKTFLLSTDLRRADLTEADLAGADLTRAKLTGAKLEQANLADADLRLSKLHRVALNGARYTAGTRFPGGFDPEKHGMVGEQAPARTEEDEAEQASERPLASG